MAEWFEAQLTRLRELTDLEEKKAALADIKIKLGSVGPRELEQLSRSLDLTAIYSQLAIEDKEYLTELCDVLKTIFEASEPGEIYQRHPGEVSKLITHRDETVRSLMLNEILRTCSDPGKMTALLSDHRVLVDIANLIGDDSLNVANYAMSIMKKVGQSPEGVRIIYKGDLLRAFARLLSNNDSIAFRVYEVVVEIAKSSKEGLDASAESGLLNSLINVVESDDTLLQLIALETLTPLALTEDGLRYLEHQELLQRLEQKISSNDSLLSDMFVPGLMKLFGNIAHCWPNEIFSKYPAVVSALFEVIGGGHTVILGAALDTLGHVAETVEGKYALQTLGDTMLCALKHVAEVIQKMPTELRIRGLSCLSAILYVKKEEQDNRILSLTKSWFDSLCDDPMGMIVALCRQPFAVTRQASLEVLAAIASQEWAQEYMSTYPGLVEFLVDRAAESFKKCKEAKFEIVRQLAMARRDIFSADVMQKFERFIKEGPFYVETMTEVAMEGAT